MKRREEEKERGLEKEGNLMQAVNLTVVQHPPHYFSSSQQKIHARALSIPPISCEGSAEGRADKWTAGEGPWPAVCDTG